MVWVEGSCVSLLRSLFNSLEFGGHLVLGPLYFQKDAAGTKQSHFEGHSLLRSCSAEVMNAGSIGGFWLLLVASRAQHKPSFG